VLRVNLSTALGGGPTHRAARQSYRRRPEGRQRQQASQSPPHADSDFDPDLAGYYENLEVPYGSDLETVRQAWKNLLRKYHPDLHSNDPEKRRIATELTQGLNRAYEELERRLSGERGGG
jgi:DnaJ-domain-containing protein 1